MYSLCREGLAGLPRDCCHIRGSLSAPVGYLAEPVVNQPQWRGLCVAGPRPQDLGCPCVLRGASEARAGWHWPADLVNCRWLGNQPWSRKIWYFVPTLIILSTYWDPRMSCSWSSICLLPSYFPPMNLQIIILSHSFFLQKEENQLCWQNHCLLANVLAKSRPPWRGASGKSQSNFSLHHTQSRQFVNHAALSLLLQLP